MPDKRQIEGIMAERCVHEENKGLTIVAKPGFQLLAFLLTVLLAGLVLLGVNLVIAAAG